MPARGSQAGRTITRLTAMCIAARREIVREMAMNGRPIPDIAAAILKVEDTAHLLSSQADPFQTVRDDIAALNEITAANTTKIAPLRELHEYRERLLTYMSWCQDKMNDETLTPGDRLRYGQEYVKAADAYARSGGVPTAPQQTAMQVNLWNMNLAGEYESRYVPTIPPGAVPDGADDGFAGETIEGIARGAGGGPSRSTFGVVDIQTFATHPDYCGLDLSDKPLQSRILSEFARAGSGFNELVCICGRRAGKGTIGSILVWYKIYRLLELTNPQRYYGVTPGQTIGTLNMANSEDQAKKNVFKHIKDRLNHGGRWFQELKAYCQVNIPNYMIDLEIRLPKDLLMQCGHSKASTKVGGTNIGLVFDEISKYKNTEGVDNAEQVYLQMKASTATFGEDALVASISSPEWELDYGMKLLRQAVEFDDSPLEERCEVCRPAAERPDYLAIHRKSHSRMFGIQMSTWDANKALTFEFLWETQNGAANPRAFYREFGAVPSESTETYYPDPKRWERQPDRTLVHPYDNAGRLDPKWKPCCDSKRFVHVDLAVSRDAAGVAMAHRPVPGCRFYQSESKGAAIRLDADGNKIGRKVVVDIALQIKPMVRPGDPMPEIDFEAIRLLIGSWADAGFPIKNGKVTYDGFQSVDSRQILRKRGFRTDLLSVDKNLEPHDTLQELVNTEEIAYPPNPVLIREGRQLILKNGRKVDHPDGGSKDVVDAVAAAVFNAYKKGGRTRFIGGANTTKVEED